MITTIYNTIKNNKKAQIITGILLILIGSTCVGLILGFILGLYMNMTINNFSEYILYTILGAISLLSSIIYGSIIYYKKYHNNGIFSLILKLPMLINILNSFISTDSNDNKINNKYELDKKNNISIITYMYENKEYKLYIPYKYNRRLKTKKIYAVYSNADDNFNITKEVEITQQIGMPYVVTADNLGAEMILVKNLSGKILETYISDDKINI